MVPSWLVSTVPPTVGVDAGADPSGVFVALMSFVESVEFLLASSSGTSTPTCASVLCATRCTEPGRLPVAAAAPEAPMRITPAAAAAFMVSSFPSMGDLRVGDGPVRSAVRRTTRASSSKSISGTGPGDAAAASTDATAPYPGGASAAGTAPESRRSAVLASRKSS